MKHYIFLVTMTQICFRTLMCFFLALVRPTKDITMVSLGINSFEIAATRHYSQAHRPSATVSDRGNI